MQTRDGSLDCEVTGLGECGRGTAHRGMISFATDDMNFVID